MNKIKIKTPNYLGGLKSIVVLTSRGGSRKIFMGWQEGGRRF